VSPADVDDACAGSYFNPTAPPGKLCLYLYTSQGVANLAGWHSEASPRSFRIAYSPTVGPTADMYFNVSWAYTAP